MRPAPWLVLPPLALLVGCGSAPVRPPPATPASAASDPDASSLTPTAPGCTRVPVTYYDDALAGRKTASGERYDPSAMTAAHRHLPFNTWLRVAWRGREVRVRVNDRGGPRGGGVDLSHAAASQLDMLRAGRITATVCGG